MKNKHDGNDLKFPVGRQPFPEPRELSMDDYYGFVVSNLELFGKPSAEKTVRFERFVIRDDDEPFAGHSRQP